MWINRMLMMIKNSRRERIASRAREEEIGDEKGLKRTRAWQLRHAYYLILRTYYR